MPVDLRELPMVQQAMAEGREEGRAEGRARLLRDLIVARFGAAAVDRAERAVELDERAQHELAVALLTLADLDALDTWLDRSS